MRIVARSADVRAAVSAARAAGAEVAFVPTMGALHAGHASLIERARAVAGFVVVSIFVNPLQFAPGEDLARYPRDLDGDAVLTEHAGADLVFAPDVPEIYPRETRVQLSPVSLGDRWEGASRPGHFAGVLTVVLKLFNIVAPDVAIVGQKDFQQAALIRAMSDDLSLQIRVDVAPIVREADGLAMSSRNRYLDAAERATARRLSTALGAVSARFRGGEHVAGTLEALAAEVLGDDGAVRSDYIALVDADTLEPVEVARAGDVLLIAAYVGTTRLIDNVVLEAV